MDSHLSLWQLLTGYIIFIDMNTFVGQIKKQSYQDLSFVIPVKDEEENLPILFEKLQKTISNISAQLIFVDDGSMDASADILQSFSKKHDNTTLVRLKENKGKSTALAAGFIHAVSDVIAIMDADLQNDPADLTHLLSKLDGYDLAIGIRNNRKDNWLRIICSRTANWIRNLVLKDKIEDSGCGLMVFRRDCLADIPLFDGFHRFVPALFLMNDFGVNQVSINHFPRQFGKSKYGLKNRLFPAAIDMLAVKWMASRKIKFESADETLNPYKSRQFN